MNPLKPIPALWEPLASITLSKVISKSHLRFLTAVMVIFLAAWLSYSKTFEKYELQTFDWRFQLRGTQYCLPEIVYVDIWDDALEGLGSWPISRDYHAALLSILAEYKAKAVVFDIEFAESSQDDSMMAKAAKKIDTFFAIGFVPPVQYPTGYFATKLAAPLIPELEKASKGVGFVNTAVDRDGKWRRTIPIIYFNNQRYFQLGLRVAMHVLGIEPADVKHQPGKYVELKPGLRIPLDEKDLMIISYAGTWKEAFKHYSYYDILYSYKLIQEGSKPIVNLSHLKDKICVIGLTAQGTHDMKPTSIETIYPGVGVYTNVLNSILTRDFIVRLDRIWNVIILFFLAGVTIWISFNFKPHISFLYTLALLTIFCAFIINIFISYRLWVDMYFPVVACALSYTIVTLTRIIRETHKRELIESELKIASQIQKSFLPASLPEQKGLSVAVFMKPAKAVGGDLYTFVPIREDKIGIMCGDVSGKGTPAALFMGKVVSEFKYAAKDRQDPSDVLSKLNDSIASESTGGLFVTLTYAIFDLRGKKMVFSNGGHLPIVVVKPDGSSQLLSAEEGMPIGVMPGVSFANFEYALAPGECFAFYSDGISEARNRKKEEYSIEALEKVMSKNHLRDAQEILDLSIHDVNDFMGKAEQHDDMTLIIAQISKN